jgi:hypothetical protein
VSSGLFGKFQILLLKSTLFKKKSMSWIIFAKCLYVKTFRVFYAYYNWCQLVEIGNLMHLPPFFAAEPFSSNRPFIPCVRLSNCCCCPDAALVVNVGEIFSTWELSSAANAVLLLSHDYNTGTWCFFSIMFKGKLRRILEE